MMKVLIQTQLFFLILTSVFAFANPPDWSVNPSNFQFNSTVTGVLYVNDTLSQSGNVVGAFVGNDVRGVATPIRVGDSWMYFMTLYSNAASGETVTFKAYVAHADIIADANETVPFVANSITGSPASPFEWHVYFNYDFAPVLSGIPDQTIEVGGSFTTFDLDDYLTTHDSDDILWSYSGNNQFTVSITPNHVVTVTAPNGFTGSESLIFTATDNTAHQYADSDTAVFTVLPLDIPPQVNDIPNQTIGLGGAFNQFDLDNYLTLSDAGDVTWSYQFQTSIVGTPAPTWSVNPSAFQFSMNMTVRVTSRGSSVSGTNHILAGFSGNDVRGVTQSVSVGDGYLFFLTLYANTEGEDISFRLYDAATQEILPVFENVNFLPNAVVGEPANPYPLSAGNILLTLDGNNNIIATVVDPNWVGSEQVLFTATDVGTLHSYSDSDAMTFTVMNDHTPLVSGIANQTIEQGESFASFDLDDYLSESDGETVTWSVTGNTNLQISINGNNQVTVSSNNANWYGSETLIFKVQDDSANAFFDTDTATFTIEPLDHAPNITNIPNQTIGLFGSFLPFDLDFYLQEQDGDEVEWSFDFVTNPRGFSSPTWSINPAQYQFSMNITAEIVSRNQTVTNGNYVLGAFVGNELRGVTEAVQAGSTWLFFLTTYSNTNGENVHFKLYDAALQDVLPVKEEVTFTPNGVVGEPLVPYQMRAGNILLSMNASNEITFEIVDTLWTGSEMVQFTVRDAHRSHHYTDADFATYSILPDHSPVVSGIPDQTTEQGRPFALFDLDDYLQKFDGDSVTWGVGFSTNYSVNINANNQVTITPRNAHWIGNEPLVFQVRDVTTNRLSDVDTALFTIIPFDHRPVISTSLSQEITPSMNFTSFDLDNFLTEMDGDNVTWNYSFKPPAQTDTPPSWNIVPSNFQYSMTITGSVRSLSKVPASADNLLAVFSGNELRGVTSPMQVGDLWLYFLTVYANTEGEQLRFQFYDATTQRLLPVKESLQFVSNAVVGAPLTPFQINAGYILATMNDDNVVSVERTLPDWLGTESLIFVAQDVSTMHEYTDTSLANFTVVLDAFGNSQTNLLFGDIPVTTTKAETLTVVNQGVDALEISSVSVDNPEYVVTPTNATVPFGGSAQFIVRFTPTSSGPKPGNLTFIHDAYRSPRVLTLTGSGQYLNIVATKYGNGDLTPVGTSVISYSGAQAYSVSPHHGHRIDSVVVDGTNLGELTEYEFSNVIAHHSISAYFSLIPAYGVMYRTATAYDWATPVDQRGLRRAINRRYDKVLFEFDLTADQTRQLRLEFNMNVQAVITKGTTVRDTLIAFTGKIYTGNLSALISQGQTIHITGIGEFGRFITSKYAWSSNVLKPILRQQYKRLQLGIPLPNLHNVGKEMFGVGQKKGAFPAGLRIGIVQGPRGGGSVVHMKYGDVIKSFGTQTDTGLLLHTEGPRCFNVFASGDSMTNRERKLPPTKQNNKLFAEALALKLNMVASATGKMPVGLGELTFNDTSDATNLFNGFMVKQIVAKADTMLSCLPLADATTTLDDMYDAVVAINNSFRTDGRLDTISFAKTTRLTGVKRLVDVLYMHSTPGVATNMLFIEDELAEDEEDVPESFALYQNYPNPFNPTTNFGFRIANLGLVSLRVYSLLGQEVATLLKDEEMEEGEYEISFDAINLPSGVYFYRIDVVGQDGSQSCSDVKRMTLIK
ncbi:MAG: T9SS type A sorting domain-containing protein [Ignavibacteriae bacterium]|nr:T9SS type A sorting domain-containing protein [Ignavibacteriota bacterium]